MGKKSVSSHFYKITTGVACVNLNRKFIGIEKDENYFKIALDRIKKAIDEKKMNLFNFVLDR